MPETLDQYEMEVTRMLSCGQASEAVHLPGPHRGLMRCFIKRSKPMFGSDIYYLFADSVRKSKEEAGGWLAGRRMFFGEVLGGRPPKLIRSPHPLTIAPFLSAGAAVFTGCQAA